MGREKPEREEKEEEERSGKKVGPGLNAGSSAPVTTAPSSAPVTLAPSPLAGHETWPGARCQSMNGAELRIHFMNSFR